MKSTRLELAVVELLNRYSITQPDEIDLDYIAYEESIFVYYLEAPTTSRIFNGMPSIVVDKRLHPAQQRVEFTHELGHILRNHAGHQSGSHQMFRELQEWQANNFATYLLCPTSMLIGRLKQGDQVAQLSREFRVPHLFMKRRLKLLESQLFSMQVEEGMATEIKQMPKLDRDFSFVRIIGRTEYFCDNYGNVLFHRHRIDL